MKLKNKVDNLSTRVVNWINSNLQKRKSHKVFLMALVCICNYNICRLLNYKSKFIVLSCWPLIKVLLYSRPTADDNSVEALVLCLIEFLFALLAAGAFPIFRQIFKGYPFMLRRIIYISLLIYSLAPPGADLSVFGLHKGPDLEIVFSILLKSVYCL